jgi:beta-galactosidase
MRFWWTVGILGFAVNIVASISLGETGIGVCYYPEHWPRQKWDQDAKDMATLGIKTVRIAEFMWEILNPQLGVYNWSLLDDAIEVLASQGLQIVLGTPTANPPKWMVDLYAPGEFLPFGIDGRPRTFGSRRHYSFSSPKYLKHAEDIVERMAQRYGRHPAVYAWQLDNEFGCHDTVRTYDPTALVGFRKWLVDKYDGRIEALRKLICRIWQSLN